MSSPTPRLRLSARSVVMAIGMLGLTLALLRLASAAGRVIGWVMAAAAVAGLLHPIVAFIARRLPHGVAVAIVAAGTLAIVGSVGYQLVDDISRETRNLQESAPDVARRLERKGRFSDVAREFDLAERTERFVDEVPARLRGGTPADALRSAATRGVAFLATAVLSIFFLFHGPRLARGAADQIPNPGRRMRVEHVTVAAYRRAFRYAHGTILMAAMAGMLAFLFAHLADIPGPTPLALWVALWDVVPLVGVAIGVLPMVGLAAPSSPGWALTLVVVFAAYQVFEAVVLQRRVERRSVHIGPFLTVAAGLVGIELYGIGGGLLAVLLVALVAAAADELAPGDAGGR